MSAERPLPKMDLMQLMQRADLSDADFDEKWEKDAFAYRAILSALAHLFSPKANITSFEYTLDDQGKEAVGLGIVLELTEGEEDDSLALVADRELEASQRFREFLKRNVGLIPSNLRDKWIMDITNAVMQGGLIITRDEIRDLTSLEWENLTSDEIVPWGNGQSTFFDKWRAFQQLVREEITLRVQK
ncbi:hypothetical protein EXS71_03735 [Candidatus Uhrbacteria bacterium]|nr:hypothetical protein [Candidatus Uhrbacteria bacterium]